MKNNCDVSGRECNRAECKGEFREDECFHWQPVEHTMKCHDYNCGYCNSLIAIRAAIEAERKPRAGDNCKSCAHASEKLSHPICGPCSYDSRTDTYTNWEPCRRLLKGGMMNEEHEPECDLSVDIDAIWRRVKKEENRADKAETELAALKNELSLSDENCKQLQKVGEHEQFLRISLEGQLAALKKDAREMVQIIDGEICECGCDMDGNAGIEEVCLICQLSAIARRIIEAKKKGE